MDAPGVPGRALHGRLQITEGLSGKSDFTISPLPEQTPAGVTSVSGCLCGSPFSSIWMPRPEAVCVSSLAAGERRPRKCRVNAAMIPGMISAMTPAMMAHAVMPAPGVSAGSPAGDYIPPPPCAPPVLPPPPPCAPLLMSSLRIDLAVRFTPTFCLPKR